MILTFEIEAIWLWGNPIECTCESDNLLKKIENKNITLDSPVMDYRGEKFRFKKEFEPKDSKCVLVDRLALVETFSWFPGPPIRTWSSAEKVG